MSRAYLTLLASKFMGVIGGLATAEFVARNLSLAEQGVFYAFLALLGSYYIFDSFSQLLLVRVSHYHRHIQISNERRLVSISSEAGAMMGKALCVGMVQALCALLLISLMGVCLLSSSQQCYLTEWILACFAGSVMAAISPVLSIIEGLGKVAEVAQMRFWQSIAWNGSIILALNFGAGIYALAIGMLCMATTLMVCLFPWRHSLWHIIHSRGVYAWKESIWPAQWRTYLMGVAVWVLAGLPVVALQYFHGDEIAGRYGMTRRLVEILLLVGGALFTTQTAALGSLYADGNRGAFFGLWSRKTILATVLVACGACALWFLRSYPCIHGFHFVDRLVAPPEFLLMLIAAIVGIVNWALYVCVRSGGDEPFWMQYIFLTVVGSLAFGIFAKIHQVIGVAWVALILAAGLTLPWNFLIARRFLKS